MGLGAIVRSFFSRNLRRDYPQVSSGQGVWLWDSAGKKYLDGCSGAVVSNIGHGVAEVSEAIQQQLAKVSFAHTSQFVSEPALLLADRLVSRAPGRIKSGGRAYFVSGGSEAIETSIKMARGYFCERGLYAKRVVVSRWSSYHGSTQGALAATGHPARRKPYLPLLADSPHISPSYPYRCLCGSAAVCNSLSCAESLAAELERAIIASGPENVMAFVAEPIVGAALGAVVPHTGYFARIREICDRYDILLIADEVMTGMGRLGTEHGLSQFDVEADIVALGKGLAAGYMPLAAVLASGKVASAFENGSGVFEHGFTYSGHPVSCAAGYAVLKYVDDGALMQRVNLLAPKIEAGLQQLAESGLVGNVRGRGFLWGVEFVADPAGKVPLPAELKFSQKLALEAAEAGLLVYPGSGSVIEGDDVKGDHIIVAPPFTISEAELDELFEKLSAALAKTALKIKSPTKK